MKKLVKKVMPLFLLKFMINRKKSYELLKLYNLDRKRFKKSAYNMQEDLTETNLRSKMNFHSHAIEKGLSNANLRLGFGKNAFEQLFYSMDKFIELGMPTKDLRFQSAISVVDSYVKLHNKEDFSVKEIENKLMNYNKYLDKNNLNLGGYLILDRDEFPDFKNMDFELLAKSRYSVRDFGTEPIEDEDIFDAIKISTKTPSVCNRQACKVYYLKSIDKVKAALEMQGGLTGNGENLNKLLLVTADKQYMNGPQERNQTYIDGGLFTMSLLYSLESKGIATCTLNTSFSLSVDRKMRKLLGVTESEDFIAFIALGSYPPQFKVAKSPRDEAIQITKII